MTSPSLSLLQSVSNLSIGLIRKSLLKDVNIEDDMDGPELGPEARLGRCGGTP